MSIVNKYQKDGPLTQGQQQMQQEEDEPMPFEGIEKSTVLQECNVVFNSVQISISKSMRCMTNVLYLLGAGHTLSASEATDVFFSATKLFQSENPKLRRLLYVFLKELSATAEQVFMVSSSLAKDMNNPNEAFKCNAIRTLRKVGDASVIGPMERHIKQALLDKSQNVTCAALTAGIHLSHSAPEMVKRWSPEVSEVLKTKGNKCQYHAMALLHKLRKSDRVSVMRLISQAQNGPLRSPLALCLLIRLCTELMQEDFAQSIELFKFVNNMTHHHSDMVVFEACKSLVSLRCLTVKEIQPVCVVLQLYLASHRSVMRFAAVRLLSRIATVHPQALAGNVSELDTLIGDNNRHISTLAVATMLKAGDESSVEKTLGRISNFMKDLNDDFKTVVVDALKIIVVKFPGKYQAVLDFFAKPLANEGSAALKSAIVDAIITMAQSNPLAKVESLSTLADFIDDCEYNALAVRILHVFGEEVHTTPTPQRFIRSVYNRISLESPVVRACAVTTLAKIGARCPNLRHRVVPLLQRCTADIDDEVRDRAVLYSKVLTSNDSYIIKSLILDVEEAVAKERKGSEAVQRGGGAGSAAAQKKNSEGASESDLSLIRAQAQRAAAAPAVAAAAAAAKAAGGGRGSVLAYSPSVEVLGMLDAMHKIKQIEALGEPMYSTEPQALTEADSEYVVYVVKHIYCEHVVLQFKVTNTMDVVMVGFVPKADTSEVTLEPKFALPCGDIAPSGSAFCYLVFGKDAGGMELGPMALAFKFAVRDADSAPGSDTDPADEYQLEEPLELNVCDYIQPFVTGTVDAHNTQWDAIKSNSGGGGDDDDDASNEDAGVVKDSFVLPGAPNLTSAVATVLDFYGMSCVETKPEKITTTSFKMHMSGLVMLDEKVLVLARAKVFVTQQNQIAMEMSMKGGSAELMEYLIRAVLGEG